MKDYTKNIPTEVKSKLGILGEEGSKWLANLNSRVLGIKDKWGLQLGKILKGGSDSLVIEAITNEGNLAILKLSIPDSFGLRREASILNRANGCGYPKLYQQDSKSAIFLVERLGKSLESLNLPLVKKLAISCQVMQNSWLKIDKELKLPTGLEKANWLEDFINQLYMEFPDSCSKKTIHKAFQYLEARKDAFDLANCVMVHGDGHFDNILATLDGNTHKLIDPEGLFAEPAYDLAIPMRENNQGLLLEKTLKSGRKRSDLLAKLTGVNELAIWQWGFIERISTGLYLKKLGYHKESQITLQIAEIWSKRRS